MSDASPRFRQDLATSPVEADGVPCVDVRDPRTGTSFRFYDFEYQLALQLNGQPVTGVLSWASQAFGADLTADGVNEFATRLRELGLPARADAAATLEVPIPKAPAAEESGENPADEWMTAQSAQTAQFVPDAAMLDGAAPTPMPARTPEQTHARADAAADDRRGAVVARGRGSAARRTVLPTQHVAGDATVPVSLEDFDDGPPRRAAETPDGRTSGACSRRRCLARTRFAHDARVGAGAGRRARERPPRRRRPR